MLGKYSGSLELASTNTVLNFKDVDTNVSISEVSKEGGESDRCENLNLGNENSTLNLVEESNSINEVSTIQNWAIPQGFQLLPEELFLFERIVPPLVSTSWLKLLGSEEEYEEDSIPLAKLKKKIVKKRAKKTVEISDSEDGHKNKRKTRKKSDSDYSPIKRKRGRPKKQVTVQTIPEDNEFHDDESEPFWNDETNVSNCDTTDPIDINPESDIASDEVKNCNEHDYSKPVENGITEETEGAVRKEKEKQKKKRTPIQGVKIGDSKISFPCLECGKSFSAASTLKCHQRLHNGTLLICPECHKGFVSKYLLKCHMRIHNGDLFMCHKCGRGFTTAELLKVHSRAHTGDRPFACDICGKAFPTSSNMLQHKQIHNSEKKFLCSQCGSSFVQKRCLDYHMLTHTEKKNICNACGKLWARKSDLVEHMRVHTGVKPYCCSICPQKFSQASSLKRHQLVHMDVKSIQCETCYKMFKCQEYYKRHLRKHEKEDYSC